MIDDPTLVDASTGTGPLADGTAGERTEALLRFGAKALGVSAIHLCVRSGAADLSIGYPAGTTDEPPAGEETRNNPVLARGFPVAIENARLLPTHDHRTEPSARPAWAGVPLRSAAGEVIGSLWMSDHRPRRWTSRELEALQELAACLAGEIGSLAGGSAQPAGPAGGSGTNQLPSTPPTGTNRGRRASRVPRVGRQEVLAWLCGSSRSEEIARETTCEGLAAWLSDCIREALHSGHLLAGDRLPSIREISRALGATPYAVADVYGRLEGLGLVERRARSGVYVAPPVSEPDTPSSETVEWMVEVLGEAVEHRLKVPQVPDLIRRWALGRDLRCLCLESVEDARVALCLELEEIYGLTAKAASLPAPPGPEAGRETSLGGMPESTWEADILVTTAYHAAALHPIAEELGKPLIASVIHPEIVSAIERHLERKGELVFLCVDPAFGERVRSGIRGGLYRDRLRVVLADDMEAVAALDRTEAVYLTRAARQKLGSRADFRLVARPSPTFSPTFARSLLRVVVDLNLRLPTGP